MKNDFYVYAWLRPCGEPFYIGKGRGKRDKKTKSAGRNLLFERIVEKIRREGEEPLVLRVMECLTEGEAFELEMSLIKLHGRINNGTGILSNMTDGGEGTSGRIVSIETRSAMSSTTKNNKSYEILLQDDTISRRLSALRSPIVRKKIGDAQRGRKQSQSTKDKRASSLRIAYENPDLKKRISDSVSASFTENRRIAISAQMSLRWQGEEYREAMSKMQKELWADEDVRGRRLEIILAANAKIDRNEKIKGTVISLWETDAHREKVADASRLRPPRRDNKSGFKGVSFCKQTGRWRALLQSDGKLSCLGRHETKEDAARAYDKAAVEAWGFGNCYLNFTEDFTREDAA